VASGCFRSRWLGTLVGASEKGTYDMSDAVRLGKRGGSAVSGVG
jgi:hypothetical protein